MPTEPGPREWSPKGPKSRENVLSKFLGVPRSTVHAVTGREHIFRAYRDEYYLVLTDKEADQQVRIDIEDSLWAFKAEFIIDHSNLPSEAEEMVRFFQEAKSEGANETIKALITDMDEFVEDAISADGRGHFLSHYDGEEGEAGGFFIYRID